MKRSILLKSALVVVAAWLGTAAIAVAGMITVSVKLPNGAPAKHATVQMFKADANYQIHVFAQQITGSAGTTVFRLHPGACFKATYGQDASGRPLYARGHCSKAGQTSLTIAF